MKIAIDYFDYSEAHYQKIKSVTFWALVTVVLVFSIVFINSCIPEPAHAQEVDMNIIATIESNNNPNAYNSKSQARGLYQITPICLKEYNQHYIRNYGNIPNPEFYYDFEDLFDPIINFRIADWYMNRRIPQILRHYKIPDCIDYRLMAYNWGIGNLNKWHKNYAYTEKHHSIPEETQNYILRYRKLKGE